MVCVACRGLALALLAVAFVHPVSAEAQGTAVKPYFMVIFDNSGSMRGDTSMGMGGTNSCGASRQRLNDAKCVLQNVVNGYGDVVFGLERYSETCSGSCGGCMSDTNCGCSCSWLNCTDSCLDTGSGCPANGASADQGQILVPIQEDNQSQILRWIDYTCSTCNMTGTNPELEADTWTPIAGSLRAARRYYEGGDPTYPSPIATDSYAGCRPYSVILLTDGEETCASDTATRNAAAELRSTSFGGSTYDIRTYVIGFGVTPGDGDIEAIAQNGGTDAPGPYRVYYATDETSLALAFSQIVADSILVETCNGADDDCDTLIDEGFMKYCNWNGMGTMPAPTLCMDPGETLCDGADNNCNGAVDEGLLNACGTCGPVPAEACDTLDNDCDGAIDEGVCMGCVPVSEICDGIDNDCDTNIDEGLSRACGTAVGECTTGTQTCTAGTWSMCTGMGPTTETCDGLDNDCDGVTDGLTRPCGSDTGVCQAGAQLCTGGMWGMCVGEIGPSMEVCDGLDNDCDTFIDEGNPGGGIPCGDDTGECVPGTTLCTGGMIVCDGAVGPTMEVCNGLDDDCDGTPDDGLGVGAPCGSDVGECSPGMNICRMGAVVCEGGVGPIPEECDLLDNDCDGSVDESLPTGGTCGTDEGLCMAGMIQCIAGMDVCVGEVPPGREVCDCEDNDCDAMTDEMPATGTLCPPGSACVDCQCALPCTMTEFEYTCPTGRTPRMEGTACWCVRERCDDTTCAGETHPSMDMPRCAPDTEGLATCVCKNNECTFPCDGVTCSMGLVCHPRDGTCVEDSCRALGCPSGEVCNVGTGECETDPCTTVTCAPDMACRGGSCEPSCATVSCDPGERCVRGSCETDPCSGVSCSGSQVCDPASGTCVPNMCGSTGCPPSTMCNPVTGECDADPCIGLHCPMGERCVAGECAAGGPGTDAGTGGGDGGAMDAGSRVDAGSSGEREGGRVLATGGGGCTCAVPGATPRDPPLGLLFFAALIAILVRRRLR